MSKFLKQRSEKLREVSEKQRLKLRVVLMEELRALLPNSKVYVFGSLTKKYSFTSKSDIDLALTSEPTTMSVYEFQDRLSEKLGRPVDVLLLSETRLKDKIIRDGELWKIPH